MSTVAAGLLVQSIGPEMRGLPKLSVVRPLGISAFEPPSSVGLTAVSCTSALPGPGPTSLGSAQMLPVPANGEEPEQTSL